MTWVSTAIASADPAAIADELAQRREELGEQPPDLCCLFVAAPNRAWEEARVAEVNECFGARVLIGCCASGVLGGGRELESAPAISLLAGHLEGAEIAPFAISTDEGRARWHGRASRAPRGALVVADPWTTDGDLLLGELARSLPGCPVVGGLASGGHGAGHLRLYRESGVVAGGAVGVAFGGDWALDTVVAQGCRPLGLPHFVTLAKEQWIHTLDGEPALRVLERMVEGASAEERARIQRGLVIGIEMPGARDTYRAGDFLIRNLVGADRESGSFAVAGQVVDKQIVQFHVRDATTSAEDLDERLAAYRGAALSAGNGGVGSQRAAPEASLLFSCVGRGEGFYGQRDHDSSRLLHHLGGLPTAGFFCNGEIGPVAGSVFLHGYTSSIGFLRRDGSR